MAKGRNDFSSSVVRRKTLRLSKSLSDEALLASAERSAKKWQEALHRESISDTVRRQDRRNGYT